MFFEPKHSLSDNYFKLIENDEITFPIHIHRSFEYLEQIKGETEVSIGKQKYVLTEGEAVLIFPLQPHSYSSIKKGKFRICIFSPDIAPSFYKTTENKILSDNKMKAILPPTLCLNNLFYKKALAYTICGEFYNDRKYTKKSETGKEQLLISLLMFADNNFHTRCLLRDAASKLGYDYAYVSKHFKKELGITFRQYVNKLRIMEAKNLLNSTSRSIEDISDNCGYSSLRSFDREFFAQTGMTPTDYRRNKS